MGTIGRSAMEFQEWKRLIGSLDSSDRAVAADCFPSNAREEDVIPLLLRCLDDPDPLVRVCAADTLSDYPSTAVSERLRTRLAMETDELAKAYMTASLGYMARLDDLQIILDVLEKDSSVQVRLRGGFGLLIGVIRMVTKELLSHCEHSDYKIRNPSFSVLDAVVDEILAQLEDIRQMALRHKNEDEPAIALHHIANILASLNCIGADTGPNNGGTPAAS